MQGATPKGGRIKLAGFCDPVRFHTLNLTPWCARQLQRTLLFFALLFIFVSRTNNFWSLFMPLCLLLGQCTCLFNPLLYTVLSRVPLGWCHHICQLYFSQAPVQVVNAVDAKGELEFNPLRLKWPPLLAVLHKETATREPDDTLLSFVKWCPSSVWEEQCGWP